MRTITAAVLLVCACAVAAADNTQAVFERLQPAKLEAVRQEVQNFRQSLTALPPDDGYAELRAVIHAHCYLSHDSRGTLEQMVAAARATGTDVIMLTDHPSREHDVLTEGFSGSHDGVLFFPGAETRNTLIYSPTSIDPAVPATLQDLIDLVNSKGGTIFLSHVEEISDFNLTGLTGMEIHNIHYGLIAAPGVEQAVAAQTPEQAARLLLLIRGIQTYPVEAFASLCFRQDEYLRPYDELTQRYRLTAIAANDSHSNAGIVLKAAEGGKVVLEDILGEPLRVLEASQVAPLVAMPPDAQPGQVLFRLQLDPYDVSMGHVGTFVLADKFTPEAFLAALRAGRCYIGFDWIASPEGFRFCAVRGDQRVGIMGDEVQLASGLTLTASLPGAATLRLFRNGELRAETIGRSAAWPVTEPGVYRLEAYVPLAGELRPWVFSNPIYVRQSGAQ